jgi:hypothetical protein
VNKKENLQNREELILDVKRLEMPSVEEIAEANDISLKELPELFERTIEGEKTINDFRDFNLMYQIWRSTQTAPGFESFASSIATADSVAAQFQGCDLPGLSVYLQHLCENVFQPRSLIEFSERRTNFMQQFGAYGLSGEWHAIALDPANEKQVYIRREILEEAARIESGGGTEETDIFHDTSSAALGGIARHGAILSGKTAISRGQEVTSGEYITGGINPDQQILPLIYMHNGIDGGYATKRWFNEFPVTFGYHTADVEDIARQAGLMRTNFGSVSMDGHEIGTELPTNIVATLYTTAANIPALSRWRDAELPTAKVMSYEVAMYLRLYSSLAEQRYPNYIYRRNSPSAISTGEILEQPPIVL